MPVCTLCGEPSAGYLAVFQARKKVASAPACAKHALITAAYQEFGQDWLRSQIGKALGIKKGSVPRVKFSTRP